MNILNELNGMFDQAIENSDKRSLGEILQEKRNEIGLSMADIAKTTGLSESLIGKIESNKLSDMKISTMKKLVLAYDLPERVFIDNLGIDLDNLEIKERIQKRKEERNK